MEALLNKITEWLKNLLIAGTMKNFTGLFDSVNKQVGQIAGEVGTSPADFQPGIFSLIQNMTNTVIMPIAGIVLTFVACYELIRLVTESNNLANLDIWILFKWVFKTAIAAIIVSNTFNIVMAVFDLAQYVIGQSAGVITADTAISESVISGMEDKLKALRLGRIHSQHKLRLLRLRLLGHQPQRQRLVHRSLHGTAALSDDRQSIARRCKARRSHSLPAHLQHIRGLARGHLPRKRDDDPCRQPDQNFQHQHTVFSTALFGLWETPESVMKGDIYAKQTENQGGSGSLY